MAVMIDLETLGKSPQAAVIQIAAVAFDNDKKEITAKFTRFINEENGDFDVETIMWWMSQPHAGEISNRVTQLGASVKSVLEDLVHWFKTNGFGSVWAHGSDFDIPILRSLFAEAGMQVPWAYNAVRDTRTLYEIKGKPSVARIGIHHDALDDAIHQARCVMEVLSR